MEGERIRLAGADHRRGKCAARRDDLVILVVVVLPPDRVIGGDVHGLRREPTARDVHLLRRRSQCSWSDREERYHHTEAEQQTGTHRRPPGRRSIVSLPAFPDASPKHPKMTPCLQIGQGPLQVAGRQSPRRPRRRQRGRSPRTGAPAAAGTCRDRLVPAHQVGLAEAALDLTDEGARVAERGLLGHGLRPVGGVRSRSRSAVPWVAATRASRPARARPARARRLARSRGRPAAGRSPRSGP